MSHRGQALWFSRHARVGRSNSHQPARRTPAKGKFTGVPRTSTPPLHVARLGTGARRTRRLSDVPKIAPWRAERCVKLTQCSSGSPFSSPPVCR